MKEQKKSHKGVSRTIRMKHNSSNFIIQDNRKPIFSHEIPSSLQQKEEKDSRYTQQSQNHVVQRYRLLEDGKKTIGRPINWASGASVFNAFPRKDGRNKPRFGGNKLRHQT